MESVVANDADTSVCLMARYLRCGADDDCVFCSIYIYLYGGLGGLGPP